MSKSLELKLILTADGRVLVGEAGKASTAIKKIGLESSRSENYSRQLVKSLKHVGHITASVFAINSVAGFASNLLKTVQQVQDLQIRIKGLTKDSADYANVEAYLSDLAQRHHKNLSTLTDSFGRLLTLEKAGLITRRQSTQLLEGMSNASSATGASNQQLEQSMYGVSQALASGVVHMEELNQVTEPLPGLLNALADASGVNVGEFRRMVAEGKLTSAVFADTLTRAFESYRGAAERAGDTLTAKYADLDNAWTNLAATLQTPVTEALTPALNSVTEAVVFLSRHSDEMGRVLKIVTGYMAVRGVESALKFAAASREQAQASRVATNHAIRQEIASKNLAGANAIYASSARASARATQFLASSLKTFVLFELINQIYQVSDGLWQWYQTEQKLIDLHDDLARTQSGLNAKFAHASRLLHVNIDSVSDFDAAMRALRRQTGLNIDGLSDLNIALDSGAIVFDEAAQLWRVNAENAKLYSAALRQGVDAQKNSTETMSAFTRALVNQKSAHKSLSDAAIQTAAAEKNLFQSQMNELVVLLNDKIISQREFEHKRLVLVKKFHASVELAETMHQKRLIAISSFNERLRRIEDDFNSGLISTQSYHAFIEKITADHAQKIAEIELQGAQSRGRGLERFISEQTARVDDLYQRQRRALNVALENELISRDDYQQATRDLVSRHEGQLREIRQSGAENYVISLLGMEVQAQRTGQSIFQSLSASAISVSRVYSSLADSISAAMNRTRLSTQQHLQINDAYFQQTGQVGNFGVDFDIVPSRDAGIYYHSGGIVGKDLGSREVNATLLKDEGVFTENQMRALAPVPYIKTVVRQLNNEGRDSGFLSDYARLGTLHAQQLGVVFTRHVEALSKINVSTGNVNQNVFLRQRSPGFKGRLNPPGDSLNTVQNQHVNVQNLSTQARYDLIARYLGIKPGSSPSFFYRGRDGRLRQRNDGVNTLTYTRGRKEAVGHRVFSVRKNIGFMRETRRELVGYLVPSLKKLQKFLDEQLTSRRQQQKQRGILRQEFDVQFDLQQLDRAGLTGAVADYARDAIEQFSNVEMDIRRSNENIKNTHSNVWEQNQQAVKEFADSFSGAMTRIKNNYFDVADAISSRPIELNTVDKPRQTAGELYNEYFARKRKERENDAFFRPYDIDQSFARYRTKFHHGGIVGQEEHATLLKGEGVFTPGQMRALAPVATKQPMSANVEIHVHEAAHTQTEIRETEQPDGTLRIDVIALEVEGFLANRIGQGRGLARQLQSLYGLRRGA